MSTASKYKWIIGIILGGILLVFAMIGGKWEISYAADAGVNAAPIIDNIIPSAVPAGTGNVIMIISGSNFGTIESNIRIWMTDTLHTYAITPIMVIDTGISLQITDTLLVDPNLYHIKVVKSNGQSIPTIPPDPVWDEVSNRKDFLVYAVVEGYLPILFK